jgi:hypothetical protein
MFGLKVQDNQSHLASSPGGVAWQSRRRLCLCLYGLTLGLGYGVHVASAADSVIADMPADCQPSVPFAVTLTVTAGEGTMIYAVEDSPPSGWPVADINYSGRFDASTGQVKWGPFFDQTPRLLSYRVTPRPDSSGVYQFAGRASFDGISLDIEGARQITVVTASSLSRVVSRMPACFVPTVAFGVTNQATPASQVRVYAVGDVVPPAWIVADISHLGSYDSANHTVKWGPFFDHAERELSYRITPPVGTANAAHFEGYGSFDGLSVSILGQRDITPVMSQIVRTLPARCQASQAITVTLDVQPAAGVKSYAIEDHPPAGWAVAAVDQGGTLDIAHGAVKWGPFFDNTKRLLTYQATAPRDARGPVEFAGTGSFDGMPVPIAGDHQMDQSASSVWREMPDRFLPGCVIGVSNHVVPAETVLVYAVEDTVPAGWSVSDISDSGNFVASEHQIKWGPFFDNQPRSLSYLVTPPASARGAFYFDGRVSFDGEGVTIAGQSATEAILTAQANVVDRILPASWRSGRALSVTNRTSVAANVSGYAVEDQVPVGWAVGRISHGGTFDPLSRKVKWGLFLDHDPRILVFEATAPPATAGSVSFTGNASFDGTSVAISGAQTFEALMNHPPVARDDTLERELNSSIRIKVANLMANDSDADFDELVLENLPAASVQGISLVLDHGEIVYSPPASANARDYFDYTISDGYGESSTATVTVITLAPSSSQNIVSIAMGTGNVVLLRFRGIPGWTYWIEATAKLDPPTWVKLGSRTASPLGEFDFEDAEAAQFPTRFYRTTSASP